MSLDKFCLRQFEQKSSAATKIDADPAEFIKKANEFYQSQLAQGKNTEDILIDGYAPFCKHIFMPNFCQASATSLPITEENEGLLKTKYEARTEKELAVLVRYFPKEKIKTKPVAKYLDLILYSREQIRKENQAMGQEDKDTEPWGLISIKPQMENYETPMQPITMLRNALGKIFFLLWSNRNTNTYPSTCSYILPRGFSVAIYKYVYIRRSKNM